MKRNSILIASLAILALLAFGCSDDRSGGGVTKPSLPSAPDVDAESIPQVTGTTVTNEAQADTALNSLSGINTSLSEEISFNEETVIESSRYAKTTTEEPKTVTVSSTDLGVTSGTVDITGRSSDYVYFDESDAQQGILTSEFVNKTQLTYDYNDVVTDGMTINGTVNYITYISFSTDDLVSDDQTDEFTSGSMSMLFQFASSAGLAISGTNAGRYVYNMSLTLSMSNFDPNFTTLPAVEPSYSLSYTVFDNNGNEVASKSVTATDAASIMGSDYDQNYDEPGEIMFLLMFMFMAMASV